MFKHGPSRWQITSCVLVCCLVFGLSGWASGKQAATPQVPANVLVREAVNKELKNNVGRIERFRYRMHKVTPEGSQIKEYVETDAGTVARLVAVNTQPLTPTRRPGKTRVFAGSLPIRRFRLTVSASRKKMRRASPAWSARWPTLSTTSTTAPKPAKMASR
jgi:hypothetical protein